LEGFAGRAADVREPGARRLRIVGTRRAGEGRRTKIAAGEALRIMTGAAMPEGADTVVIRERARVEGMELVVSGGERRGANVRPAGEDYRCGDLALRAGQTLDPACVGALASLGLAWIEVARQPQVSLCTSGDELVAPGDRLGPGQIHDSNCYSLSSMLSLCSAEVVERRRLLDDRAGIARELRAAAVGADVIVSCGGVSAGEADFLPRVIAETGRVHFWKVLMKPGMPFLFGEIDKTLLFALPGNPVSAIVCFLVFVQPALAVMQGADPGPRLRRARLVEPLRKRHARREFLRARTEWREDGSMWATVVAQQGSGMLHGVADADALLVIPEDSQELEAGAVVEGLPLPRASWRQ
jgi:molybdopterin molybdotransferase